MVLIRTGQALTDLKCRARTTTSVEAFQGVVVCARARLRVDLRAHPWGACATWFGLKDVERAKRLDIDRNR
jgi:hypothetical protein